jgi:5-methylcytosine-specific restriction endonuclease McrA
VNDESTPQKRCSKCGETKPLDAFSKYKRSKDGYKAQCKACINAYNAANPERSRERSRTHYAANRESILAKQRATHAANPEIKRAQKRAYNSANREKKSEWDRAYRIKNAESVKAQRRAYYEANAESIREKTRAYNSANPERKREMDKAYRAKNADSIRERRKQRAAIIREYRRAYRERNVEAICAYQREWKNANQDQIRAYRNANLDLFRAACQKRRARKKNNGGSFTEQELIHMRLTQGGFCAYCQRQHDPDALTIDHIISIDQGGRHEAANIVLACPTCNSSKGNRTPDQWVNRWYWRQRKDDE